MHARYTHPADAEVARTLQAVSRSLGRPPAQVALAWLLAKPGVTAPIVGVSRLSHLDDAVAALDVALEDSHMATLEAPYVPHAIIGH